MNCRDFERTCNERLDARGALSTTSGVDLVHDPELVEHANACPACRALGARYQALGLAIGALSQLPPPVVPAGFADRVLAAAATASTPDHNGSLRIAGVLRRAVALAAAAALILAAGLSLWAWRHDPGRAPRERVPVPLARNDARATDPRDLTEALADATSATLSLAREASAPAARVGSQVLGDAGLPESPPALAELSVPGVPAAEVWQTVGDRVNAGVVPLSGSARSAFSFLLGTRTGAKPDAPATPRPPHGA